MRRHPTRSAHGERLDRQALRALGLRVGAACAERQLRAQRLVDGKGADGFFPELDEGADAMQRALQRAHTHHGRVIPIVRIGGRARRRQRILEQLGRFGLGCEGCALVALLEDVGERERTARPRETSREECLLTDEQLELGDCAWRRTLECEPLDPDGGLADPFGESGGFAHRPPNLRLQLPNPRDEGPQGAPLTAEELPHSDGRQNLNKMGDRRGTVKTECWCFKQPPPP